MPTLTVNRPDLFPDGEAISIFADDRVSSSPTEAPQGSALGTVDSDAGTVEFDQIAAPTTLAGTPSITGGTLAADDYFYVVTAINGQGETLPSDEDSETVASGTTGSVALTWDAVPGASGYRVYRGTATGDYDGYYEVSTNAKTDTGAAFTAATAPPDEADAEIVVYDKGYVLGYDTGDGVWVKLRARTPKSTAQLDALKPTWKTRREALGLI